MRSGFSGHRRGPELVLDGRREAVRRRARYTLGRLVAAAGEREDDQDHEQTAQS
jgi:hypothetical protein